MATLVGLLVVFGSVLGGFALSGGPFPVLLQPNEFLVIAGAAVGTLLISTPGAARGRVMHALKQGFSGKPPGREDYRDLLRCLYHLFLLVRRDGALALESHLNDPAQSAVFQKYPSVLARHHALAFMTDGLRQFVDGCRMEDLTLLFDAELETLHEEEHQPVGLIRSTGDALPGLGIVAAVLGIVITMGHLDGGPEEIGHHVAAALVGTFLGILLCYGMVGPIATSVEMQNMAETRYLLCIKDGILAAVRGSNPKLSIEFARRQIFGDERPSSAEMDKLLGEVKA